jgi:tRNA threonylcarbamoyladenosine biosynthesis protein TsaB
MGEIYVAAYEHRDGAWNEARAPAVLKPDSVPPAPGWVGAGNGFDAYPELREALQLAHAIPQARATARAIVDLALPRLAAGEGVAADQALPVYVRHRVALTEAQREAGQRL